MDGFDTLQLIVLNNKTYDDVLKLQKLRKRCYSVETFSEISNTL